MNFFFLKLAVKSGSLDLNIPKKPGKSLRYWPVSDKYIENMSMLKKWLKRCMVDVRMSRVRKNQNIFRDPASGGSSAADKHSRMF